MLGQKELFGYIETRRPLESQVARAGDSDVTWGSEASRQGLGNERKRGQEIERKSCLDLQPEEVLAGKAEEQKRNLAAQYERRSWSRPLVKKSRYNKPRKGGNFLDRSTYIAFGCNLSRVLEYHKTFSLRQVM